MNFEISKYLNQYIQNNFPKYYKALNKRDFMSFVGSIASNPALNEYEINAVTSGFADKTINQLVERYAQLRLPEIWKENVYNYLNTYIQEKFPMYHKFISKEEFNSFVESIVSDPVIKEYGLYALLEGTVNKTVDKLVENYAQLELTNVWANFGSLCNYIKNVIVQSPDSDIVVINEKTLDDISKKIAEGFIKDNGDYSYYMNGAYDRIFLAGFDAYCDKTKKDCNESIKRVIENSNLKIVYDKLTYEDLLEQVMNSILSEYEIDDIVSSKYDVEILEKFKFHCAEMKKKVASYVRTFVNNIDVLTGIPVNVVVSDITRMAIETGELSAYKLLNGELDQFIEDYSNKKRVVLSSGNKDSNSNKLKDKINPVDYICDYIVQNLDVDRNLSYDDFIQCAVYINGGLSIPSKNRDRGLTPEEIVSTLYDSEIVRYYNRYMMKKNSTERGNVPKRTKPKKKRRFMQKSISVLLLTATLLGVFGTGAVVLDKGVELYKDSVSSIVTEFKSIDALDEFDDYKYTHIFYNGNDAVEPTAKNALEFHVKVQENGYNNDNYDYLGFYRAYQNVHEDRLYIMDTMLNIVKREASQLEDGSEFHKSVSNASCYLEFAMDRLEDMGYEEIKDQKYHDALFAYLEAKSEHPGDEPLQHMDVKDRNIVKDIMKKYQEYSDELMTEFAEIRQEEKSGLKYASVVSGRRI